MENLEKESIIKIFEKILNTKIEDIKFEATKDMYTIADYNFSLKKATFYYKDGRKEEIFLKMIKGGKIKESIFCYWSILYEEFLKNNKDNEENNIQKAIITQVMSDKSSSCILLTLNAELNYCAEINLIELRKYFYKENEYERWLDKLGIKDDDILFIGKKMY